MVEIPILLRQGRYFFFYVFSLVFSGFYIHFIHRRVKLLIDKFYKVVDLPASLFFSYINVLSYFRLTVLYTNFIDV